MTRLQIILIILLVNLTMFTTQLRSQTQCLQLAVSENNNCLSLCTATNVTITPETGFQIIESENELWIDATKGVAYSIKIEYVCGDDIDDQANALCASGDYKTYTYTGGCCQTSRELIEYVCDIQDTIEIDLVEWVHGCPVDVKQVYIPLPNSYDSIFVNVCEPTEVYKKVFRNYLGCDSVVTYLPIYEDPVTTVLDSIVGQMVDTIITTYTNQHGCDSFTLQIVYVEESDTLVVDTVYVDTIKTNLVESIDTIEEELKVYIPNVFSPDRNGINDCFQIFTNGVIESVIIADRWGNIIVQVDNPDDNCIWDGDYRNISVSNDVYIYSVLINKKVFKGNITIL